MSWMRQTSDVERWFQYECHQFIRFHTLRGLYDTHVEWTAHLESLIRKELDQANIEVLLGFLEVIKWHLPPLVACSMIETVHKLLKNKGYNAER